MTYISTYFLMPNCSKSTWGKDESPLRIKYNIVLCPLKEFIIDTTMVETEIKAYQNSSFRERVVEGLIIFRFLKNRQAMVEIWKPVMENRLRIQPILAKVGYKGPKIVRSPKKVLTLACCVNRKRHIFEKVMLLILLFCGSPENCSKWMINKRMGQLMQKKVMEYAVCTNMSNPDALCSS